MDGAGAQGHACCLPALQEVVVAMVEFLEPPAHMLHLVQALLQWNAIRRGEPARGCCRALASRDRVVQAVFAPFQHACIPQPLAPLGTCRAMCMQMRLAAVCSCALTTG
jgi:hypothetical protein